MKSTLKIVLLFIISVILLVVVYLVFDYWKGRPRTIHCEDGERQTIDYRDLQVKYSGNKISLEVEVMDKLKLRSEIDPKVLQTAYESTQNWDQFLKGLVVGYNSCAISKKDYALILQRYKKIEEITKSLSQILRRNLLTQLDVETAKQLIEQYSSTAREISIQ
ncbi:MAG: hypothetical protein WCO26_08210 [Deltaproteobacteria bacterium]